MQIQYDNKKPYSSVGENGITDGVHSRTLYIKTINNKNLNDAKR